MKNIFNILLVVSALEIANSSNILGFFATPCRSNYIVHESLMKGLAAEGHNVSIVWFKLYHSNHYICLMILGDDSYSISNGQIGKIARKLP